MQQNTTENTSKLSRSPENVTQHQSTNPTQFAAILYNPRFAITPESMGMNLHSDYLPSSKEQRPQEEPPPVEIKFNNERHNNKSMTQTLADCRHESNESFHSPQYNTPTTSYASVRTEHINEHTSAKANNVTQCPSPNASPKPAMHQWNFENHLNSDCAQFLLDNQLIQPLKSTGEECEKHLQKRRSASDNSTDSLAKLNFKIINDIYKKRIESIDQTAWGHKDLKISTYQEWVELLIKITESFISNMEELEMEVEGRLNLVQKRANSNCRHSQGNEILKCRKDIDTLLKYIRNAHNCNEWGLQGLTFETIKPSDVFGEYDILTAEGNEGYEMKHFNDPDNVQNDKLYANIKALAHEVAEKHDEVRELKRQVICLEDEIQKAQKKIQLKDDVIKELRNDLKCASNKASANQSLDSSLGVMPLNFENQTSRSANTQTSDTPHIFPMEIGSYSDSLTQTEQVEHQKIKDLKEEFSELFVMNHNVNAQKFEQQQKKLKEIVWKIESEKAAACNQLEFIRRQLIALESNPTESSYDCDSGFHSKSENDQDAKRLDTVRKRLHKLNETNCELKKRIQKLELDKNELTNSAQSEKCFSERNREILKQIADVLSIVTGKQFFYTEAYKETRINPFCEAIMKMQKDFQERENKLLNALDKKAELSQLLLLSSEKDFSAENLDKFKDIDSNTTTLASRSSQLQPVTAGMSTEPPHDPTTLLSLSLTGQQLDNTTATSLPQGLVDKQSCVEGSQ